MNMCFTTRTFKEGKTMKKLLSCLLLLAVMATSFAFASAETTTVSGVATAM